MINFNEKEIEIKHFKSCFFPNIQLPKVCGLGIWTNAKHLDAGDVRDINEITEIYNKTCIDDMHIIDISCSFLVCLASDPQKTYTNHIFFQKIHETRRVRRLCRFLASLAQSGTQ